MNNVSRGTITTILSILIVFFLLVNSAFASVGTVSVTTSKNSNTITAYTKNSDNKYSKSVKLELQKNGKTVSIQYANPKRNQQVKNIFKLYSKGKYRIKYTVGGKYSYTTTYNY